MRSQCLYRLRCVYCGLYAEEQCSVVGVGEMSVTNEMAWLRMTDTSMVMLTIQVAVSAIDVPAL